MCACFAEASYAIVRLFECGFCNVHVTCSAFLFSPVLQGWMRWLVFFSMPLIWLFCAEIQVLLCFSERFSMKRAPEGLCAPQLTRFSTHIAQLSKNLSPFALSLVSLPCAEKGEREPSQASLKGNSRGSSVQVCLCYGWRCASHQERQTLNAP